MTSSGNHSNHYLFSMIFSSLIMGYLYTYFQASSMTQSGPKTDRGPKSRPLRLQKSPPRIGIIMITIVSNTQHV